MSDEQLEMTESFFADKNSVVEDSGTIPDSDLSADKVGEDGDPGSESISESKPKEKALEQTVKKSPSKEQTQEAVKDEDAVENGGKDKKPEPDKDDVEKMLFKTGKDGQPEFDIDEALRIAEAASSGFKPVATTTEQTKQETTTPGKVDDRPEYVKRAEEIIKRKNQYLENLTMYKTELVDALAKGVPADQAFYQADRKVNEIVEREIERVRYEEDAKRQEEREKEIQKREESAQLKPRSAENLRRLDQELKGNLNKLLIGEIKDGKHIPGIGTNDVNKLFELMNPDHGKISGQELQKRYQEWWLNITADEHTARWLTGVAQLRLLGKSIPSMLKSQRSALSEQGKAIGESKSRPPSKTTKPTTSADTSDAFDAWLKAPPGKKVDVIG
jgi:hypothetical protein